jgi:hypothetical protein
MPASVVPLAAPVDDDDDDDEEFTASTFNTISLNIGTGKRW